MRCDSCYRSGPSAHVQLRHNVGMLFIRREYATEGELCRPCLHRAFWHHTLRNLTLGWWGVISFFMTWYFLVGNLLDYVQARMELGKHEARHAPSEKVASGEEALRLLGPFEHNVRLRLRDGEAPSVIGADLSRMQGVALDAALRFVEQVRASEEQEEAAPVRASTGS